jgi:hypothetical protein
MLISLAAAATVAAYHNVLATHFLEPGDETVLYLYKQRSPKTLLKLLNVPQHWLYKYVMLN